MKTELIPMLTEIRDLLRENNTLLRENLTSAKTLAERREKNRQHMQAVRSVCTQALTENEERKEAGEKEKLPPAPPIREKEGEEKREGKETLNPRAREEAFSQFWAAYPSRRRVNKRKCFEKYSRLLGQSATPRQLADEILAGLEHMKRHPDWLKENGEFVPMPMTFLNQERWIIEEPSTTSRVDQIAASIVQEIGGIQ